MWEVHMQGEVPQELVPDGEVDPDGSRDFVQKGHRSSGELIASKGARLVREGAVGNVPRGNALAAYFTFFVCDPFTPNSVRRGRVGTLFFER